MNIHLLKEKNQIVHFIGINGISMSGLAEMVMGLGHTVTGSDIEHSNRLDKLKNLGARIYIPHDATQMGQPDVVVYTAAVHDDNPEYQKAQQLNIPLIDRALLLGGIMASYPYGIGVSGAHGKTTTTAMVSYLLEKCGFDPTIHIGGEATFINGTVKVGQSPYFVTEACEYNDSFLKLSPYIGIVLNIDYDHVDWFKDLDEMKQAFLSFVDRIPKEGYFIGCYDDENTRFLFEKAQCHTVSYGLDNTQLDYTGKNITYDKDGHGTFDLYIKGQYIDRITLGLQGRVNVLNALSAIGACHILGASPKDIVQALITLQGAKRRMDFRGDVHGIKIFSDYAHHPTEIDITLEIAKNMDHREIWAVFEPHTYTRIQVLFEEFSKCFSHSDHVIMADVYNDREVIPENMSSEILAKSIAKHHPHAMYLPSYQAITNHLATHARAGDIVMILGSKNIVAVADMLYDTLRQREDS